MNTNLAIQLVKEWVNNQRPFDCMTYLACNHLRACGIHP